MKKQISVANLVMLVGGAVTFLFSFFPFWGAGSSDTSAWGSGVFPLATIPAILGGAMLVVCVLEQVGTKLPDEVLTFNWRQVLATWGITSLAIMLAFLIVDKPSGLSLKFGGILMLIGSIAMAVGSVLALLGKGTNLLALPGGGSTTPTPPPPPAPPPANPPPPPPPA
jgi:hypothetical protein